MMFDNPNVGLQDSRHLFYCLLEEQKRAAAEYDAAVRSVSEATARAMMALVHQRDADLAMGEAVRMLHAQGILKVARRHTRAEE